jgi:hypothetical protein
VFEKNKTHLMQEDIITFSERLKEHCVNNHLQPPQTQSIQTYADTIMNAYCYDNYTKQRSSILGILGRGYCIETAITLGACSISEVAKRIGCKASKPSNSGFVLQARALFHLIVTCGITRLRYFCPTDELSITDVVNRKVELERHLKNKSFWCEEPVQYVNIKKRDGTIGVWVDPDWLLFL